MLKNGEFTSVSLPTSSSASTYSPLLIRGKREEEEEEIYKSTVMVDTVTTDSNSLCCEEHTSESRSNSTMGSSSAPKRLASVISARGGDTDGPGRTNGGSELLKAVFLFFFLFFAGVSNWAVIAYTHDFVPREPLPDLVFSLIPEQRWASSLGDFCVALCIILLGALLFVHQHRGTVLKRVVFCAATLYGMRSCTLAATQLPSGYTDNESRCRERLTPQFSVFLSRLFEQTIRIGFQSKDSMLCGDLLFSGHTLVMVTCSLAVAYYLPRPIKGLQWIAHISCAIGMICMIISRTHYTIDVMIAYWLSNMVFRIYHAYCEVDMCMERQKSILFSWWPCRIIDWLEENIVPGRLENRLQIPNIGKWRRRKEGGGGGGEGIGGSSSESSTCEAGGPDNCHPHHHHHPHSHHKHVSISSSSTYPLPC